MSEKMIKHFMYNKDIAKKNGISVYTFFVYLIGSFLIFCALIILRIIFMNNDIMYMLLTCSAYFIVVAGFIFGVVNFVKITDRNKAYTVSESNRIFMTEIIHVNANGGNIRHRFGNIRVPELYNQLGYKNSYKESKYYMQIPEIIDTMIREAGNGINGGEVYEIKDVHSIQERKDSYLINCDCIIMRVNKIYNFTLIKNKFIQIGKVYNDYEKLIEILKTHMNNEKEN